MIMSTEANKSEESKAILRELDELMDYIDTDNASDQEDLIDPAFFIGNMNDNVPDVPTLTTVANEPAVSEQPKIQETTRQPGLFSARVERLKQSEQPDTVLQPGVRQPETQEAEEQTPATQTSEAQTNLSVSEQELNQIIDALVAEQLPKIEAQLREKLLASLDSKKQL